MMGRKTIEWSEFIGLKVSEDKKAEIKKAARRMGVSASAYIRIAVDEKLNKED